MVTLPSSEPRQMPEHLMHWPIGVPCRGIGLPRGMHVVCMLVVAVVEGWMIEMWML